MSWNTRIVGSDMVDPSILCPNPKNWRRHPKYQREAMTNVFNEIGWIQDIIVNKTTGHIIDGHMRVDLAVKNKEKLVPVKYVELTEEEERQALITYDPLSSMAETNRDMLNALIGDIKQQVIENPQPEAEAIVNTLDEVAVTQKLQKYDPVATEWTGMPEFKSEDKTAAYSVLINFENLADMTKFADVTGLHITEKTKSAWYPYRAPLVKVGMAYESDE